MVVVGVDFDNTIISYDRLMHRLATERSLISANVPCDKRRIRNAIRRRAGGEMDWRRLQAAVYGPLIGQAELIEGVVQFLEMCKRREIKVYVVSHKTELAAADETGTSLREAALDWMFSQGLFARDGSGISPLDVYFEDTRQRKIERILRLACTHFIDDLLETFMEPTWPAEVDRILYAPNFPESVRQDITVCATWEAIRDYLFAPKG